MPKYTHVVTVEIVTEERVSEKAMSTVEAWLAGGVAAGQFESAKAVSAFVRSSTWEKTPKTPTDQWRSGHPRQTFDCLRCGKKDVPGGTYGGYCIDCDVAVEKGAPDRPWASDRALKTEGAYRVPGAIGRVTGQNTRRGWRPWHPETPEQVERFARLRERFPGLDERGQFVQVAGPVPLEP